MREKVWVDMKAVDKIVGPSPCMKDGGDCAERCAGCHGKCERYIAWKERRDTAVHAYYAENGADLAMERYKMERYHAVQRMKGEKVKER